MNFARWLAHLAQAVAEKLYYNKMENINEDCIDVAKVVRLSLNFKLLLLVMTNH